MLNESQDSYSTWYVQSAGTTTTSNNISGNANGDTYTRVVDKNLSDYTIDELTTISNDIAINGQSSQY